MKQILRAPGRVVERPIISVSIPGHRNPYAEGPRIEITTRMVRPPKQTPLTIMGNSLRKNYGEFEIIFTPGKGFILLPKKDVHNLFKKSERIARFQKTIKNAMRRKPEIKEFVEKNPEVLAV